MGLARAARYRGLDMVVVGLFLVLGLMAILTWGRQVLGEGRHFFMGNRRRLLA